MSKIKDNDDAKTRLTTLEGSYDKNYPIGGWLIFFIIIFGIILPFLSLMTSFTESSSYFENSISIVLVQMILLGLSILCAYLLLSKNEFAVPSIKGYILLLMYMNIIVTGIFSTNFLFNLIFLVYFYRSKRVKKTYSRTKMGISFVLITFVLVASLSATLFLTTGEALPGKDPLVLDESPVKFDYECGIKCGNRDFMHYYSYTQNKSMVCQCIDIGSNWSYTEPLPEDLEAYNADFIFREECMNQCTADGYNTYAVGQSESGERECQCSNEDYY